MFTAFNAVMKEKSSFAKPVSFSECSNVRTCSNLHFESKLIGNHFNEVILNLKKVW